MLTRYNFFTDIILAIKLCLRPHGDNDMADMYVLRPLEFMRYFFEDVNRRRINVFS